MNDTARDEITDLDASVLARDPPAPVLLPRGDAGLPGPHRAAEPEGQRHRQPGRRREAAGAGRRARRRIGAKGLSRGWLHGVPRNHQDAAPAAGSPPPGAARSRPGGGRRRRPDDGAPKAAGAIVIGKTNMPEFGLGSHTFNELFGATPNAWDPAVTAGGSSGGAAVALALRLLPVADGSDFMGSLRNRGLEPCLRPAPQPGRVPMPGRPPTPGSTWLGTEGPMAHGARPGAAAGHAVGLRRAGAALGGRAAAAFGTRARAAGRPARGLALGDLGGHLPMEPGLLDCCESALRRFGKAKAPSSSRRGRCRPGSALARLAARRRALVGPKVARC